MFRLLELSYRKLPNVDRARFESCSNPASRLRTFNKEIHAHGDAAPITKARTFRGSQMGLKKKTALLVGSAV